MVLLLKRPFDLFEVVACRFATASWLVKDGEAVANGQNHCFDTWVVGYEVVKKEDAAGLIIHLLAMEVGNLSVPERVVGNDEAPWLNVVNHKVEIVDIVPLVGIDENQVEVAAKLWHDFATVANM